MAKKVCGYAHIKHIKHEHGKPVHNLRGYHLCENCYTMVRNAEDEYDRAMTEYYSKKTNEYIEKNR